MKEHSSQRQKALLVEPYEIAIFMSKSFKYQQFHIVQPNIKPLRFERVGVICESG